MKLTKNEFIKQSEAFMGRELTKEEIASINACDCGSRHCSGWTGVFDLLGVFPPTLTMEV